MSFFGFVSPHIYNFFFFQGVDDFVKAMAQTSYNIKEGLPDLVAHSRKILGLYIPQLIFSLTIYSRLI